MANWYYAHEGERVGPIGETEFQSLVSAGMIRSETLVWTEGMSDWKRYGEVRSRGPENPARRAESSTAAHYSCVECGKTFPADEMVQYEGSRVCATCKPVFFQRLKEGVPLRGVMVYGGFWIRAAAKIIDWFILWIVNTGIQMGFGLAAQPTPGEAPSAAFFVLMGLATILQIAVAATYNTWFLGKFAATPGKMACGLKAVTSSGGQISYLRALGRHFAEMLSALILGIGYIMAAFDEEKRTLHDRICDTRVIRK